MKLKTKITAAAVGMLLLLSQAFSAWTIAKTQDQIIDNILRYEADRLSSSARNFNIELDNSNFRNTLGELYAGQSAFRSSNKDLGGIEAVLYYNGREAVNNTPYQFDLAEEDILTRQYPNDVISEYENISVFIENVSGSRLLILFTDLGAPFSSGRSGSFRILHYRDITSVYESGKELFFRSIAMALFLSALLAAVLTFILGKILSPFYQLRDAANVIAEGNYEKRVEHPGTDEVGEVSRSFNKMAEHIEEHIRTLAEMNEKQRRLIGSLSHELKTPMTGIQGYAELLQRVQLSPDKQTDALHYIEQECIRLSRLSAKMLQLTELSDETKIEKKPCSMAALFAQAKEITRCRLGEKDLSLQIDLEKNTEILCDEDLLLSFLTNLIDNACKASPAHSRIRLFGTESGIFVEDEGCGIPEDEIARITEPFYMVNKSRSRKEGGAGLGLALCLQIARLHDGQLKIQSTSGKGTCIGMQLDIR